MKFLSLFYKYKKGGFAKRMALLFDYLVSQGNSLYFVGTEALPLKRSGMYNILLRLPFKRQENLIFWFCFIVSAVWAAFSLSVKHRIRHLITFGPFYTVLCVLPILIFRLSAITFIRGDNMKHSRNRIRNAYFYFMDWAGIVLSTRIITVSGSLKAIYQSRYRIPEDKILVLPNNIERSFHMEPAKKRNLRQTIGIPSGDFIISAAGVLNEGKNFSFLISSLRYLKNPSVKLMIIGDEIAANGERNRLESLAKDLKLHDRVWFCGWQPEPMPYIACSNVFVIPSKYEGSPNVLLEALGADLPCLGADIPSIREVLEYDELLFPLSDETIFAEKVYRMNTDPDYRRKLQQLSQTRSKHYRFDWGERFMQMTGLKQ